MNKNAILTLFVILLPFKAYSYDFEVDGIYYNIISEEEKIVEVTHNGESEYGKTFYSGEIVLPSIVQYNGEKYNVIQIGKDAFRFCRDLLSVVVPDGIQIIEVNAFDGCWNLQSVTLPSTLKTLCSSFSECRSLTILTIPEGVEYIAGYCFDGCLKLREISLPSTLTIIERNAFQNCKRLQSIVLPSKLTYLDYETFKGCISLAYIVIQADEWYEGGIADDTFDEETFQSAVLYVNNGKKDYYKNLLGWKNFKTIVEGEKPDTTLTLYFEADGVNYHITSRIDQVVEVTSSDKPYQGNIIIPGKVTNANKTYLVKAIGESAFGDVFVYTDYPEFNDKLISVTISDGVETINNKAFLRCVSLTTVKLPNSLIKIGDNVFSGCVSLADITLPNNLQEIGKSSFDGCESLQQMNLPDGLCTIPIGAFTLCTKLSSVQIGDGITRIGEGAFAACKSLSYVKFPQSLKYIDLAAFDGCGLTSVELPEGLKEIHSGAFRGNRDLQEIVLPQTLSYLGSATFMNCESLHSIAIPNGITDIDMSTFDGCTSLSELYLPATINHINYRAFRGCQNSLTNIRIADGNRNYDSHGDCNAIINSNDHTLVLGCRNTIIPNDVTSIGDEAFQDCATLTNIIIPGNITSIGHYAFAGCTGLTTVTLPQKLDSIGWGAFQNCTGLTSIHIPENVTTLGYWAFSGCNSLNSVGVRTSQPYFIDASAFMLGVCQPIGYTDINQFSIGIKPDEIVSIYTLSGRRVMTIQAFMLELVKQQLAIGQTYIIKTRMETFKFRRLK